jgi:hypothetical protein
VGGKVWVDGWNAAMNAFDFFIHTLSHAIDGILAYRSSPSPVGFLSLAAGGRQVSRKKKKCGWANFLKLSYREFSHHMGVGRVWYDWGR